MCRKKKKCRFYDYLSR
jgi:hypothetical protein